MKFINRKKAGNEPKEVQEKRVTPSSTFDSLPKESLREALLTEQGFICAYCLQRIKNDWKTTKVEHWSPRTPENEKDYMNLPAVCKGNEGRPETEQHCDTLKKKQPISISPLHPNCEKLVKFDPGGHIYSDDQTIDNELKNVLGLERQHLVDERQRLMDRIKGEMEKTAKNNADAKIKKADLNKMLKIRQAPRKGKYEPFCQVAIAYINKKIARLP